MSRTNIDLPDDLVEEVMRRYDLPTKKSAVAPSTSRRDGRFTANLPPDRGK